MPRTPTSKQSIVETSSPLSSPSKRPRKTPEQKELEQKEKEQKQAAKQAAREAKDAWKASLVPWKAEDSDDDSSGGLTINKTKAMKTFKLNDEEMSTLPHQTVPNFRGYKMFLYSKKEVKALSIAKHGKLPESAKPKPRKKKVPAGGKTEL